jgi:tetratricopeptide (TPR) repeat protein
MKTFITLLLFIFAIQHLTFSQGKYLNPNESPDYMGDYGLDRTTSSYGILIKRMTTTERNKITSPTADYIIYNITTNCFETYVNKAWQPISCPEFSGVDSLKISSFNQDIEKGDEALLKDKYKEALEYYNKANELMPKNKMVSQRMEIISCYDRFKDNEELYVCLIAKADYLFAIKEYKIARIVYIIASKAKEDSRYPKNRIKEIDKILDNSKDK